MENKKVMSNRELNVSEIEEVTGGISSFETDLIKAGAKVVAQEAGRKAAQALKDNSVDINMDEIIEAFAKGLKAPKV